MGVLIMRPKIFLGLVALSTVAAVAACVGDDPATSSGSGDDGGSNSDATIGDGAISQGDSGDKDAGGNKDAASAPDADDGGIAAISGLSLWLETDGLTPGLLGSWNDQSSHHNNASAPANDFPIVSPVGVNINGHPVVTFDGGDPYFSVSDSTSLQPDATGFLIEIVERSPAATLSTQGVPWVLFDKQSNAAPYGGPSIYVFHDTTAERLTSIVSSYETDASVTTPSGLDDTPPHRIKLLLKNVSGMTCALSVQIDSTTPVTKTVIADANFAAADLPLYIGRSSSFLVFPYTGDVAAIIAVRTPSDDDVARVDTYLKGRYGL